MENQGINLASKQLSDVRDKEAALKRANQYLVLAVAIAVLLSALIVGVYAYTSLRVRDLSGKRASLERSIKSKSDTAQAVSNLQARGEKFSSIIHSRLLYSAIVTKISSLLPGNITLKNLTVSDAAIEIQGKSVNYSSLAKLIEVSNQAVAEKTEDFPFSSAVLKTASLDSETGTVDFSVDFVFGR